MQDQQTDKRFAQIRQAMNDILEKLASCEITPREANARTREQNKLLKDLQKELGISNDRISSTFNLDKIISDQLRQELQKKKWA